MPIGALFNADSTENDIEITTPDLVTISDLFLAQTEQTLYSTLTYPIYIGEMCEANPKKCELWTLLGFISAPILPRQRKKGAISKAFRVRRSVTIKEGVPPPQLALAVDIKC